MLSKASELFYRDGIRAVGVERIITATPTTRATFYRHFPSKDELVDAYLLDTDAGIRAAFASAAAHATSPVNRVELLIDGLADDIESHTRGCPFINAAAEFPDPKSDVRLSIERHREWFRSAVADALTDAGVDHADEAAVELLLLRDAAMVGGYLDGWAAVRDAFISSARRAARI